MIAIEREPKDAGGPPFERCCFCRAPSPFWTLLADRKPGAQVACCQDCAASHEASEVPTKRAWCDKEKAIYLKEHPHARY